MRYPQSNSWRTSNSAGWLPCRTWMQRCCRYSAWARQPISAKKQLERDNFWIVRPKSESNRLLRNRFSLSFFPRFYPDLSLTPLGGRFEYAFPHIESEPVTSIIPDGGKGCFLFICVTLHFAGFDGQGDDKRFVFRMNDRDQPADSSNRTSRFHGKSFGFGRVAVGPEAGGQLIGFCVIKKRLLVLKILRHPLALIRGTFILDTRSAI